MGGGLFACLRARLFSLSLHPSIFAILMTVLCFLLWGGVGCAGVKRERESGNVWKFHGLDWKTREPGLSSPPREGVRSPLHFSLIFPTERAARSKPLPAPPRRSARGATVPLSTRTHTHPACLPRARPPLFSPTEREGRPLARWRRFSPPPLSPFLRPAPLPPALTRTPDPWREARVRISPAPPGRP
jgi:hypothetical protein